MLYGKVPKHRKAAEVAKPMKKAKGGKAKVVKAVKKAK